MKTKVTWREGDEPKRYEAEGDLHALPNMRP